MGAGEVVAMGGETRLLESNVLLGCGFAQPASTGEVEPAPREERFLSGAEGDFFVGAQGLAEYLDAHQQGWVVKLKVLVRELDYSQFYGRYKDDGGRRPIHPRVVLGLIVYGITQGKWSLRELERAVADGVGRDVVERPGAARSQHDWQVHSVARAVAERAVLHDVGEAASQHMLIRLFQHTTICWGLGLRRVMSRTLGDDRRRTASIFVPAARNRDRARIGGTCSPRTSGTRPGTLGRPLRRRTESETGEESWERTDETLPTLHLVVS